MKRKPALLLKKNLLALAKASVGSKFFRQLYFRIGRDDVDVLEDGNLSCAFFVSCLLKLSGLIPEIHTTVKETVKDMRRAGWRPVRQAHGGPIRKPKAGAVVVYAPKKFKNGSIHKHIGFLHRQEQSCEQ